MNGTVAALTTRPAARKPRVQTAAPEAPHAEASTESDTVPGVPRYLQAAAGMSASVASPPATPPSHAIAAHGVVAQVHTDSEAGAFATSLGALAATLGSHTFFAPGAFRPGSAQGDRLIRHELAHVAQAPTRDVREAQRVAAPDSAAEQEADSWSAGRISPVQQRAQPGTVYRHPVITTAAEQHTEADVVGTVPGTGMKLKEFDAWSRAQLDWFIGISAAKRLDLWRLRALLGEGEHIRNGLGEMRVQELIALPAASLDPLRWYAAGSVDAALTVHITAPTAVVADAIDRGTKMHVLEPLLGGAALRIAMPQTDFEALATNALWWQRVLDYATSFQPLLEVAKEMPVFRAFIAGANPLAYVGMLRGRMRNLHRFPIGLLNDEVRLWGTRGVRAPPVTLAIQAGHDWGMAFENADKTLLPPMAGDPRLRLLILEGQDSLATTQAAVLDIAANFGPIRDVFIIGHGESRQIGSANAPGAGWRDPKNDYVNYRQEDLNLANASVAGGTPTTRLFDALLRSMDPAQARVTFLGCLVGTTEVPQQIADPITKALRPPTAMEIRAFYADPQRMAMRDWLAQRPAAIGLAGFQADFATGARADTAIGGMTSLTNPFTGRARVSYGFDSVAFSSADDYVRKGLEATGLMRALREQMVSSLPNAIAAINYRVANPVAGDRWWSAISNAMAVLARPQVLAGNLTGVHALEDVAQRAFLALFLPGNEAERLPALSAAHAAHLFPVMLAALGGLVHPNLLQCRLIVRRAWAAIDATQVPNFAAELDTTTLLADKAAPLLLPRARLAPMLPALLPLPVPVPPTRGQLLLAFSLAKGSPQRATPPTAADPQELQFLYGVAAPTRSFPAPLSATLLAGFTGEADLLEALGLGAAAALPAVGGPPPVGATDRANARLGGPADATNDVFIHGLSYMATVVPAVVSVRAGPNLASGSMHVFKKGDSVRVLGVVHDWAAVEYTSRSTAARPGRIGFIWGDLLSPKPTP